MLEEDLTIGKGRPARSYQRDDRFRGAGPRYRQAAQEPDAHVRAVRQSPGQQPVRRARSPAKAGRVPSSGAGGGLSSQALYGVQVFAPDGKLIGRIALPERCANVCFGGLRRNRLFMAASQSVYALYVNTQGALGG
jgi:SMP-30/Gluconolactonase/LRE-like region